MRPWRQARHAVAAALLILAVTTAVCAWDDAASLYTAGVFLATQVLPLDINSSTAACSLPNMSSAVASAAATSTLAVDAPTCQWATAPGIEGTTLACVVDSSTLDVTGLSDGYTPGVLFTAVVGSSGVPTAWRRNRAGSVVDILDGSAVFVPAPVSSGAANIYAPASSGSEAEYSWSSTHESTGASARELASLFNWTTHNAGATAAASPRNLGASAADSIGGGVTAWYAVAANQTTGGTITAYWSDALPLLLELADAETAPDPPAQLAAAAAYATLDACTTPDAAEWLATDAAIRSPPQGANHTGAVYETEWAGFVRFLAELHEVGLSASRRSAVGSVAEAVVVLESFLANATAPLAAAAAAAPTPREALERVRTGGWIPVASIADCFDLCANVRFRTAFNAALADIMEAVYDMTQWPAAGVTDTAEIAGYLLDAATLAANAASFRELTVFAMPDLAAGKGGRGNQASALCKCPAATSLAAAWSPIGLQRQVAAMRLHPLRNPNETAEAVGVLVNAVNASAAAAAVAQRVAASLERECLLTNRRLEAYELAVVNVSHFKRGANNRSDSASSVPDQEVNLSTTVPMRCGVTYPTPIGVVGAIYATAAGGNGSINATTAPVISTGTTLVQELQKQRPLLAPLLELETVPDYASAANWDGAAATESYRNPPRSPLSTYTPTCWAQQRAAAGPVWRREATTTVDGGATDAMLNIDWWGAVSTATRGPAIDTAASAHFNASIARVAQLVAASTSFFFTVAQSESAVRAYVLAVHRARAAWARGAPVGVFSLTFPCGVSAQDAGLNPNGCPIGCVNVTQLATAVASLSQDTVNTTVAAAITTSICRNGTAKITSTAPAAASGYNVTTRVAWGDVGGRLGVWTCAPLASLPLRSGLAILDAEAEAATESATRSALAISIAIVACVVVLGAVVVWMRTSGRAFDASREAQRRRDEREIRGARTPVPATRVARPPQSAVQRPQLVQAAIPPHSSQPQSSAEAGRNAGSAPATGRGPLQRGLPQMGAIGSQFLGGESGDGTQRQYRTSHSSSSSVESEDDRPATSRLLRRSAAQGTNDEGLVLRKPRVSRHSPSHLLVRRRDATSLAADFYELHLDDPTRVMAAESDSLNQAVGDDAGGGLGLPASDALDLQWLVWQSLTPGDRAVMTTAAAAAATRGGRPQQSALAAAASSSGAAATALTAVPQMFAACSAREAALMGEAFVAAFTAPVPSPPASASSVPTCVVCHAEIHSAIRDTSDRGEDRGGDMGATVALRGCGHHMHRRCGLRWAAGVVRAALERPLPLAVRRVLADATPPAAGATATEDPALRLAALYIRANAALSNGLRCCACGAVTAVELLPAALDSGGDGGRPTRSTGQQSPAEALPAPLGRLHANDSDPRAEREKNAPTAQRKLVPSNSSPVATLLEAFQQRQQHGVISASGRVGAPGGFTAATAGSPRHEGAAASSDRPAPTDLLSPTSARPTTTAQVGVPAQPATDLRSAPGGLQVSWRQPAASAAPASVNLTTSETALL